MAGRDEIEKLRREIDVLDEKIVRDLNERAKIALSIKKIKQARGQPAYDPQREEDIFKRIAQLNEGHLSDMDIREIYQEILKRMKNLE